MNSDQIIMSITLICFFLGIIRFSRKYGLNKKHKGLFKQEDKSFINVKEHSDISTKPLEPGQDLRYDDYINSAWEEIEKH